MSGIVTAVSRSPKHSFSKPTPESICLLAGTRLHLGCDAVVEVTGLRDPCAQLNTFQPG